MFGILGIWLVSASMMVGFLRWLLLICLLGNEQVAGFLQQNAFAHMAQRRVSKQAAYRQKAESASERFQYQHLKFAVFGGGAFSLALAKVLSYKNIPACLLVRQQSTADTINLEHFHPKYLSQCALPGTISATTDPSIALLDADYIIHAVPMQSSRAFLQSVRHLIPPSVPILSATKGIEQGSCCLMNDIIQETLGAHPAAYLSGPSFAQEIMAGLATAVVIASDNQPLAETLADILSSIEFRCHTSRDVKGIELSGAMKNVIALAAGMCEGLGLGMNAMSSLITRGCIEMTSIGRMFGADQETFYGLAGVGDTFGTCLGPLSRNRKVGYRLAKGESLEDILLSLGGVSEGVDTAAALEKMLATKLKVASMDLKFPIISGVSRILKGSLTPQEGLDRLMRYPLNNENRGQ